MTITKPKIAINNRIKDLMENKQEIESFKENKPDFSLTKSMSDNSLLCIAESKQSNVDKNSYKEILLRLDLEIEKQIKENTTGSKNAVINKLLAFALKELKEKEITLK